MATSGRISEAFLDDFANAWNRHDVDAILSMMTADCVFESSRGPDVAGMRYVGQAEVRRGIEDTLTAFPDARWNNPKHFIAGDRGVTEWVFFRHSSRRRANRSSGLRCVHVSGRENRREELLPQAENVMP